MKFISSFLKKISIIAVVLVTFFPWIFKPLPVQAQVLVPVGDFLNGATHTANAAVNTTSATFQDIAKMSLDALAYTAGQLVLNQLTENTIKWIQGGFHGSPSFAVDVGQLESDLLDAVAGDLINMIKDISVCEFSVSFKDDLMDSVYLSKKKVYNPKCPFDASINFTASQFYNDFNRGGWMAFGMALEDSGNPYGVQVLTAQQLEENSRKAKERQDQKLAWSNGFTNIVDLNNCNYPAQIANFNGPIPPAEKKQYDQMYCKTTTPGNIVSNQLSKTLGLDMDRLGFADNMNKIISAVLNQLAQQTLRSVF